jgi:zinc transport system permease protein
MWIALLTSVAVVALHLRHARLFFFVSFDPDAAAASGVPIRWVDGLLFVSMGLSIAVATRTIGSLPVFAVAVFPAAAALQLFKTPVAILLCAASLGAISAFVGYWLSFEMGFPTGACTAACSIVPLMVVALRRLRRR